jgi:hypothetical protein
VKGDIIVIKKTRFSLITLISLVFIAIFSINVYAATWSSADKNGTWVNGGYTVYNNVWAQSGYGPQTIWTNTYSNWGVWSIQMV